MNRPGIPLGKIFGIRIGLDYSWFVIFALLTWMLAKSYYPAEFTGWSPWLLVDGRGDGHHAFCQRAAP